MSDNLRIMNQAETASFHLTHYSLELGEKQFEELIELHPKDGMVYFKRAQAHETIGKPEEALKNYQKAKDYFFDDDWRSLAGEGIIRCQLLPQLDAIPEQLRNIWKDALYFRQLPFRCRPMMARAALEKTLDLLIAESRVNQTGTDLASKLSDVKRVKPDVPDSVLKSMATVKKHGDDAAHGEDVTQDQADICEKASMEVLQFLSLRKRRNK